MQSWDGALDNTFCSLDILVDKYPDHRQTDNKFAITLRMQAGSGMAGVD
jgi:hypothetical protein